MKWWRWSQRAQQWRDEAHEHIDDSVVLRVILFAVGLYLATTLALGVYWSREPALFSVAAATTEQLPNAPQPALGSTTAAALFKIVTTLLDKPGGFVGNDVAPPGVWLDNMSSWELGALGQARDAAHVFRENWGRETAAIESGADARARTVEDVDLGRVEPRLNFSANSWSLPASESQYREAADYLHAYLLRLQSGSEPRAVFVANAANLNAWLVLVSSRLSDLSQRLSACVAPHENPALAMGDPLERATTPQDQIDNVFYEARGSTWVLIHLLRGVEIDFAESLQRNNAQMTLHRIIGELEATQEAVYSPVILNGSGFGMLANHSLVMASYIARANASLINLRNSIAQDSTQ
jgi:hypothetical protein